MDQDAKVPVSSSLAKNLNRPINADTSSKNSSSSSTSPSRDFLRNVQAALKRHRPQGAMLSDCIRPQRMLVPQRDTGISEDIKKSRDEVSFSQVCVEKILIAQTKSKVAIVDEPQEDASITPPSVSGTITKSFDESCSLFHSQVDEPKVEAGFQARESISALHVESQQVHGQKMVHFSIENKKTSHEFAGNGWVASSQGEASAITNHNEAGISLLAHRTSAMEDQLHQFRNFLIQPITHSSVVGPAYATTTSVHSTSAPMHINSTTHYSHLLEDSSFQAVGESLDNSNVNPHQHVTRGNIVQPSGASQKDISGVVTTKSANLVIGTHMEMKENDISNQQKGGVPKQTSGPENSSILHDIQSEGKASVVDVIKLPSESQLLKNTASDVKLEPYKKDKQEKTASGKGSSAPRKRNYDPDLFFKVNGKLYQRLGKIGSGGSSEVHKVISSNCTIYALKKIKLRGRDYATAYGFCQEIVYLNKLKGKNNIIQLVDYEVTDKSLLQQVMNGSMINKDARVKEDGYIYMVLEYGEIDLAHMLSQKWKEMEGSNQMINENWLRFYWQQILQAVNTIHEERIVHSDLKPANFLLVKGSLKLIDFGIAKAIMSDTTNIQRDSQVGTLSYMSPEAFMCNESDENGNTIKCGRPSDIWSLGCILYQMVYGRTPFSDYKTFWAKFKVITDPNHQIKYEPVSNPWLLDLMKKCLSWDRHKRWRIPQLLHHPFLVPPVSPHLSLSPNQSSKLLQLIAQACTNDKDAKLLFCSQLKNLLRENAVGQPLITSLLITSQDDQCELIPEISRVHLQLQKHLEYKEK